MPRKRTVGLALLFAGVTVLAWITHAQDAAAGAAVEGPNAGWLTLLPPILAILMALAFRQVVPALLAGIWVGAWIVYGHTRLQSESGMGYMSEWARLHFTTPAEKNDFYRRVGFAKADVKNFAEDMDPKGILGKLGA